jgi:Sel1 repeat
MRATVTDHEAHAKARIRRHHSGVEFCCTRGRKPVQRMLALHMTAASDYATTLRYRLAADQGNAGAQYNLGLRYANSQGVPQDFVRAHMWLNLSAAQGEKNAVEGRDKVVQEMTPEQIAEAQKLAREWKPKLSEENARLQQRGLWQGAFIAPWDWRHRNNKTVILGALSVPIDAQKMLLGPSATEGAPSPDCTIKGNINRDGERIYHLEHQSSYAKIRMDKGGDRRWFCTPEEAEAAGWRRAVR